MKKRDVDVLTNRYRLTYDEYEGESAVRVIADAKWRRSRGRRPTMSYRGEHNPQKALKLAVRAIESKQPLGTILECTKRAAMFAWLLGEPFRCRFNDYPVVAYPGETTDHIRARYQNNILELRRRHGSLEDRIGVPYLRHFNEPPLDISSEWTKRERRKLGRVIREVLRKEAEEERDLRRTMNWEGPALKETGYRQILLREMLTQLARLPSAALQADRKNFRPFVER